MAAAARKAKGSNASSCFEILGFDIMIDRDLKPWLIEVNSAPSFKGSSALDKRVKTEVITESIQLLGMTRIRKRKYLKGMKREWKKRLWITTPVKRSCGDSSRRGGGWGKPPPTNRERDRRATAALGRVIMSTSARRTVGHSDRVRASSPSKTKGSCRKVNLPEKRIKTGENGKRQDARPTRCAQADVVRISSASPELAKADFSFAESASMAVDEAKAGKCARKVSLLPEELPLGSDNFHVLCPFDEHQNGKQPRTGAKIPAHEQRESKLSAIVAATEKLGLGIFYKEHRRMSTSAMKE